MEKVSFRACTQECESTSVRTITVAADILFFVRIDSSFRGQL